MSIPCKETAYALLETRVQLPNENVTIFTDEITKLFQHADHAMAEDKKLRFLMRGVKQELFAGLVHNSPNTVDKFLTEAKTIEKALEMRTRQYDCRSSTANFSEAHALSTDDVRETI